MEHRKIIVFDEDGRDESLIGLFRNGFNDPSLEVIFTESPEDFESGLAAEKFYIILINFHTPYFWDMNLTQVRALIDRVEASQPCGFQLMGCTPSIPLQEYFEKKGLQVIQKKYDRTDIRLLFESPRTFSKTKTVSIDKVARFVSGVEGTPHKKVISKTRKRPVVKVRQIAIFLTKRYVRASLQDIADYFGMKNHTSPLHSCETVESLMDTDQEYKENVLLIADKIEVEFGCIPVNSLHRTAFV